MVPVIREARVRSGRPSNRICGRHRPRPRPRSTTLNRTKRLAGLDRLAAAARPGQPAKQS
jgi:hypothetical protein